MKRLVIACVLTFVFMSVSACSAGSPSRGAEQVTPDEVNETVLGYYADVRAALGDDAWSEELLGDMSAGWSPR